MSSLPPVVRGNFSALPKKVQAFVEENAKLCTPKNIHICDGTKEENESLIDLLVKAGTASPLAKHDNWYVFGSVIWILYTFYSGRH